MFNILLEGYSINEKWLYKELKNYIKSDYTVAVIAFSFRDSIVKTEKNKANIMTELSADLKPTE